MFSLKRQVALQQRDSEPKIKVLTCFLVISLIYLIELFSFKVQRRYRCVRLGTMIVLGDLKVKTTVHSMSLGY